MKGNKERISRTFFIGTESTPLYTEFAYGVGIKKLVLIFVVFLSVLFWGTSNAQAQSRYYVRPGASGSGNGSDWNNAFPALPGTLVRGATYYLADGVYGSYTWDDPNSGSTKIFIKKATVADHGTDVGWQDDFGNGSADFNSWDITTSNWEFDGQVGQWAGSVHGVPALPNYVPYGFRVVRNTNVNGASTIKCGRSSAPTTNVTLRHVESAFTNTPRQSGAWGSGQATIDASTSDLLLSYVWFHDAGQACIYSLNKNNVVVEYSVLERNGHGAAAGVRVSGYIEHSEIAAMWGHPKRLTTGPTGIVFRYNYIRDWRSTGGIMAMGGDGQELTIYGNIFTTTGYWTTSDAGNSNGMLNGLDSAQTINAKVWVYNNTFVDVDHGAEVFTRGTYAIRLIKNNLFYNVSGWSGQVLSIGTSGLSRTHNWYYGSGNQSESNIQNGTVDPFVNRDGSDYRLSTETNDGDTSIAIGYYTDLLGNPRGADGTWDRGAFENTSGPTSAHGPGAPLNLRIIN